MEQQTTSTLAKPVNEYDHTRGPSSAVVSLVGYGDYQCPYTKASQPVVKELLRISGDWLMYAYRHFPNREKHEHAQMAAEAAEAAGAQGMFWQMHDYLFDRQDDLSRECILEYADELGLDMDQFENDLNQHVYAAKVDSDYQSALDSGVEETPTFFINGKKYVGRFEVEPMLQAIEDAGTDTSEEL